MNKGESRPSTGTSLHELHELHEFQPRYPTLISKKVLRRELKVIQLMQVMQANVAGSKDLIRSFLWRARQSFRSRTMSASPTFSNASLLNRDACHRVEHQVAADPLQARP
jgi:hypothetical protein